MQMFLYDTKQKNWQKVVLYYQEHIFNMQFTTFLLMTYNCFYQIRKYFRDYQHHTFFSIFDQKMIRVIDIIAKQINFDCSQSSVDSFVLRNHLNKWRYLSSCSLVEQQNSIVFIYSNQMEQSINRQTIDPFYKQGTVFERDEAYYSQYLTGTRRISNNLQGSLRQSSLQRSRNNISQSRLSPSRQNLESKEMLVNKSSNVLQLPTNANAMNVLPPGYREEYEEASQENARLKRELDQALNGSNEFGNTSNVVILNHYARSEEEAAKLHQQEVRIAELEDFIAKNEPKISSYKKGVEELQVRMNNIQTVDRQIIKILKSSPNRDRELLQKALNSLHRGENRQEVAKTLQQIISP